jgi:LPS sulfotransferase NodH
MASRQLPFLKLRSNLVLRKREALAYVADLFRSPPGTETKKILIFAQGRSGTTLFESLMCSTGYFTGYHEVLNTVTREVMWPTKYVRGLGRQTGKENIIIHVKPEHLGRARKRPVDAESFLKALHKDGWYFVHIERSDLLKQIISKYLAKARGSYHKTDEAAEKISIHIPPEELLAQYQKRKSLLADEKAILAGFPHFQICYDTDLEKSGQHQKTVNRILNELGLPSQQVSTKLRKINAAATSDFLSNFEELKQYFEARNLAWTL